MKKILLLGLIFISASLFAQTDDELFGGDDDFFFEDAGIEELEDVSASSDLSRGILFENGAVRVGGNFTSSIETSTTVYKLNSEAFTTNLKNTSFTPNVNAFLFVDARPNQDLRMYSKFGLRFPFQSTATSTATTTQKQNLFTNEPYFDTKVSTSVTDWIYLKELFTDFSIADAAYFRFGLHTVTWGAGYFFSPVSDIINTTSINPEDVEAQVDGCLNLRAQIPFSGTQNCLWLYVIPSTDFTTTYSAASNARDTAFAAKYDLLLGGWELGFGGYLKYQAAPKATFTATGSIGKFSLFGEAVYQYGAASEWTASKKWSNKTDIIQATAGLSRMWSNKNIMFAAQYYYDGNDKDMQHQYFTYGHNIAAMVSFGRLFGTTDITASVFGMINIGKDDIPDIMKTLLSNYGIASFLSDATISAMLYYSPTSSIKIGLGPYMTIPELKKAPQVDLKLSFTLGGGSF